MTRSLAVGCSLLFASLVSTASAQTEPPACAAVQGPIECQEGRLSAEFSKRAPAACSEALEAHCRIQYTKDLVLELRDLNDQLVACGNDRALAIASLTEKNSQLRRLRRLVRFSRR